MKFTNRYVDQHEAAIAKGGIVRIGVWGGNGCQYLLVLNVEPNEYIHCEGCSDRTPFYLSTGKSDPEFVCSDECAAGVTGLNQ